MDAYLYTFTTARNWTEYENNCENDYENDYAKDYEGDFEDDENDFEDDENDFDPATIADFGLLQRIPAAFAFRNELGVKHSTVPVARKSTFDYASVHPDHWPSLARAIKALWNDDELRRPAYVEMSYSREGRFACPHKRTDYSSNWLRIKKALGFHMKLPAMIRRSPLQQSMTWEEDDEGEYIKEVGFPFPPTFPPALYYDSYSDEEQDESQTPLGSPFMASFYGKKGQFDEYSTDTDTAAVDIIPIDEEGAEIKTLRAFVNFNQISDSLDIKDILGYAGHNTQHKYINETTICGKSISPCEMKDVIRPTKHFWEKEITAAGGIRHNQVGECVQEEARKPAHCMSSGMLLSRTPYDSPSIIDFHTYKKPTPPSIALNDSHARRDPVVDLTTVNNMAHSLTNGDTVVKKVTRALITAPCAASRIGDKTANTQNNALSLIRFAGKAQATVELDTTMAEATHIVLPATESWTDESVDGYIQSQIHDNPARAPRDPTSLVEANDLSPDLVYVKDPTSPSLVCNMTSTGRFALPSVPWGRIAVAAAGVWVDIIGSVSRR